MSKARVQITTRDLAVLGDINAWGVLSLEQIRRRHFASLAVSVSSERLGKLHDAGLILKQRVGILMHHGRPKETGSVATLTQAGLKIVQRNGDGGTSPSPRPYTLNTSELHHDLLLVDLAESLKARQPGCHVVRCERGTFSPLAGQRVPDLIATVRGIRWAVELELTTKSSTRYLQILASYRVQSDLDRVLYVVSAAATAMKIRRLLGEHRGAEASPFGSLGIFSFRSLAELLSVPTGTDSMETKTQNTDQGEKNL